MKKKADQQKIVRQLKADPVKQNRQTRQVKPPAYGLPFVDASPATQLKKDPNNSSDQTIQMVRKEGKQQAGMPAKAKAGSPAKQQSKAQRAYNAILSYRSDFCKKHNVTLAHVMQFLAEGHQLHGHASADSNSNENPCTTSDMDVFIGWFRKKYDISK